ncbi:hypothetical protein AQUCO_08300017v1 [Aquilegia coerulea]|uniref:Uncharacterized protein n=1 Tax=Aquilegia coerulea TaxID=218851 RepID=A0A2G5C6Y3_AQUCA|nr:hypothetical protein AQUCO_08300017v1 [Aquilegia coerulea]
MTNRVEEEKISQVAHCFSQNFHLAGVRCLHHMTGLTCSILEESRQGMALVMQRAKRKKLCCALILTGF